MRHSRAIHLELLSCQALRDKAKKQGIVPLTGKVVFYGRKPAIFESVIKDFPYDFFWLILIIRFRSPRTLRWKAVTSHEQ